MSYTLELTKGERDAIDWVGHRYSHGNDLFQLLTHSEVTAQCPYPEIEEVEWNDNMPIEFSIPEWIAWRIRDIRDEDPMWCCFNSEFAVKLNRFVDSIV